MSNRNISCFTPLAIRTAVTLTWPSGVAFDGDGNTYVSSFAHGLYRLPADGDAPIPVAGSGSAGLAGDGGPASGALLDTSANVEIGPRGGIYVADQNNSRIRRIAPSAGRAGAATVFAEAGVGYVMSGNSGGIPRSFLLGAIQTSLANQSLFDI